MSRTVELDIEGMTCASCASRIEKVLGRQPGVSSASVNFAMERAVVEAEDPDPEVLKQAVAKAGYGAKVRSEGSSSGEMSENIYGPRAVLALTLALPAMALGMIFAHERWAMLSAWVLVTPVLAVAGRDFFVHAVSQARRREATMDTLVAVGTGAAYVWSVYAYLAGRMDIYFEVAGIVVAFVLLGKYLEHRARAKASSAIRALMAMGAKQATIVDEDGSERVVDVSALEVGQLFKVKPGEKIATDGDVVEGASAVDESMVTGESVPVERAAGDTVIGGTVNAHGMLMVRATKVGAETALAQIARLVDEAQTRKAPVQRLADKVAGIFVPIVLVIATLTVLGWLAFTDAPAGDAIRASVAVLIIACPCAMGLATPAAIMAGTGRGASSGIIFRGGEVLESARAIDAVLLDKTGTITQGAMVVTDVVPFEGVSKDEVLRMAAGVESNSEHPIARAIVDAAPMTPQARDFSSAGGLGAQATVDGSTVFVGRLSYLHDNDQMGCADLKDARERLEAEGRTVVSVGWGGREQGVIALSDPPRASAKEAVSALTDLGLRVSMVTGDNERTAGAVADAVGIGTVLAGVMPEDKVAAVRSLQEEGLRVAMVGDGVNDAPALAQADLGIAIGSGTDVAIEAADVTLVGGDPRLVGQAIRLARRTYSVILQNLGWAFGYNILLIPVAAIGLVDPALAGLAMALSSVSVVTNALRLRRSR
ncbi:MAG: heavy metal translocating P-type ATPase [Actinomycetota bacterium]